MVRDVQCILFLGKLHYGVGEKASHLSFDHFVPWSLTSGPKVLHKLRSVNQIAWTSYWLCTISAKDNIPTIVNGTLEWATVRQRNCDTFEVTIRYHCSEDREHPFPDPQEYSRVCDQLIPQGKHRPLTFSNHHWRRIPYGKQVWKNIMSNPSTSGTWSMKWKL